MDRTDCGCGEPSADDWADALTPDAREREAIRRAEAEGWIRQELAERLTDRDALARRIHSLPGSGGDDATRVPEVMAAYYRRAGRALPAASAAATHARRGDDADHAGGVGAGRSAARRGLGGDAVAAGTVPRCGPAAAPSSASPRSEGWEVPLWQPRVEIYLDVSGSMPDPRLTRNAMTLAAQILRHRGHPRRRLGAGRRCTRERPCPSGSGAGPKRSCRGS